MTVFSQSDVWRLLLAFAGIVGWLASRLMRARATQLSPGGLWAVGIGATVTAFLLLLVLNQALDRSAPEEHPTRVLLKTTGSTLKGGAYKLHVAAAGHWREPQSIAVDEDLYRAVEVGDGICLQLHRGALGAPYLTVKRSCEVR